MKLNLLHYSQPQIYYAFDPDTGVFTEKPLSKEQEAALKFSGFASERKIGLWKKQKIFVALFALDGKQRLQIGTKAFDFMAGKDLHAKRRKAWPVGWFFSIWHFSITGKKEFLAMFKYWFFEHQVWPDNGDIFSYVEEQTKTDSDRDRFLKYWIK